VALSFHRDLIILEGWAPKSTNHYILYSEVIFGLRQDLLPMAMAFGACTISWILVK
jgi:hypothetical protein